MKKIVMMVSIMLFCVALTACGAKKENNNSENSGNDNTTQEREVPAVFKEGAKTYEAQVVEGLSYQDVVVSEDYSTFNMNVCNVTTAPIVVNEMLVDFISNGSGYAIISDFTGTIEAGQCTPVSTNITGLDYESLMAVEDISFSHS